MYLSLAQVDKANPRGPRRKRYFCPICQPAGGKTPDLSLDRNRGLYHCFKCGASGLLEEFRAPRSARTVRKRRGEWTPPTFAPVEESPTEVSEEYVDGCRRAFAGSVADDYERSRGIDGIRTRMGFDPSYPFLVGDDWVQEPAVVFFFEDLRGRVVAKQGRMLREATGGETAKITFGKVSYGVFNAAALANDEVIVCEGPNTAAALVERGYPAIALGGKTAHEWLVRELAKHKVWIGLDNDPAGRKAAADLLQALHDLGGEAELLMPTEEGKDWNDVLEANPRLVLPGVRVIPYEPGLEDLRAQCRRLLRTVTGEARELLEEWDFALERGFEPARAWWRRYGKRLVPLL